MEILPPSDEVGGQREALDGGREKQYCLRNLRIVRILSSSLPQSASQTAPSSDGAKAANDLFRQAEGCGMAALFMLWNFDLLKGKQFWGFRFDPAGCLRQLRRADSGAGVHQLWLHERSATDP